MRNVKKISRLAALPFALLLYASPSLAAANSCNLPSFLQFLCPLVSPPPPPPPTNAPVSVPEPATLALLGLGLAGVGIARRKKS